MRQHQLKYRVCLQIGVTIALFAVPFLAYAKIQPSVENVSQVVSVPAKAKGNPAVAVTKCDGESWPNYSPECVRGQDVQMNLRQIAMVTNDTPLTSMPRAILAPITSQHVVTSDALNTSKRLVDRRRVAKNTSPRLRVAVGTQSALAPISVNAISLPAGW